VKIVSALDCCVEYLQNILVFMAILALHHIVPFFLYDPKWRDSTDAVTICQVLSLINVYLDQRDFFLNVELFSKRIKFFTIVAPACAEIKNCDSTVFIKDALNFLFWISKTLYHLFFIFNALKYFNNPSESCIWKTYLTFSDSSPKGDSFATKRQNKGKWKLKKSIDQFESNETNYFYFKAIFYLLNHGKKDSVQLKLEFIKISVKICKFLCLLFRNLIDSKC